MSSENFKYVCTLRGHEADVRSLCPFTQTSGGILSCSRDLSAKSWIPHSDGLQYEESTTFVGHKKFVSCVAIVGPMKNIYPGGLVLTGSNDTNINAYLPNSSDPIMTLTGHTNAVSSLRSSSFGIVISGSWDKTARMWLLDAVTVGQSKCMMVMSGHEAAVWDVLIVPEQQGAILTASADKTIKLWKAGKCLKTFQGHSDCVRGLASISSSQFLSCSNDASVKRWSIDGECLQTYYGHKNFVYSIDFSIHTSEFVTSSEDRTVRVWSTSNGTPLETLPTPATSVWKVVFLENGDIAAGCSDATIRVFSRNESRAASLEAKMAYEEELSASTIPESGLDVGDVNVENLPGPEALEKTGHSDGQTMMIRNNSTVEAYQWSAAEGRWIKVGDVIGSNTKGKKSMYQGKEYDYVFTIDIQEGAPSLHLPYNLTDDAWFAAQKFIDDNDLSQHFLDQVANFIIENTKGNTAPAKADEGYVDPFTGQGRYTPGSDTTQSQPMDNDPYTGSGRYVPSSANEQQGATALHDPMLNPSRYVPGSSTESPTNNSTASSKPTKNMYFPKVGFIHFEARNASSILGKLQEHSRKSGEELSDNDLKSLESITQPGSSPIEAGVDLLWKILHWEPDLVFPALDLLRLAFVTRDDVSKMLCDRDAEALLDLLLRHLTSERPVVNNQLLSLRVLSNVFRSPEGLPLLLAGCDKIVKAVTLLTPTPGSSTNIQTAIATLFINFSVAANNKSDLCDEILMMMDHRRLRSIHGVVVFLNSVGLPSEALFRHLVALGTLLTDHDVALGAAHSLKMEELVRKVLSNHQGPAKVSECGEFVLQLLSNS